jgi:hypothetical protein
MEVIKLKRKLTVEQGNALAQQFLPEEAYDLLLTTDADVYNLEGELLLKFRKNVIPFDLLKSGYDAFKDSISITYDQSRRRQRGTVA